MKPRSHSGQPAQSPQSPKWGVTFLFLALVLPGMTRAQSATPLSEESLGTPVQDPFEAINRTTFAFNEFLDGNVLRPVAMVYRDNFPAPIQAGVSNFFGNLLDLWSGVNSVLQAKPSAATHNTARFVINSTIGIYGVFDIATRLNIERQTEDFGQTLGVWGLPSGPYLVLPLLGPSTLRDGLGTMADSTASLINQVDDSAHRNGLTAARLLEIRARILPITEQIDRMALDKYSFVRDAFLQKRLNDIHDGNPPDISDTTSPFQSPALQHRP